MRIVEPPSLDSPWRGRHGDLDGLLSDFFRSELPKPWPEPPIPDEQPQTLPLPARKPFSRWSAVRSRLALAASIALLLAGGWFLSGKFEDVSGSGDASYNRPEAIKGYDQPGRKLKEDEPRRHRIFVDPSGQAGLQFDVDLP